MKARGSAAGVTFRIELAAAARRALTEALPQPVAAACLNFLADVLAEQPHRVGKPLPNELARLWSARRGEFRVIYQIDADRLVVRVIHPSPPPRTYA